MTNLDLMKLLMTEDVPEIPVVIHSRFKTGIDQGDIFESVEITVTRRNGKLILEPHGYHLIGGW